MSPPRNLSYPRELAKGLMGHVNTCNLNIVAFLVFLCSFRSFISKHNSFPCIASLSFLLHDSENRCFMGRSFSIFANHIEVKLSEKVKTNGNLDGRE